ncbi:hypothetical protein CRENBAI_022626 [Crenichthys baileyi]|uniref:Uncharacterized protein n=1 Tax=Crenichthys baileyi TaxID=28760 RepID=A0AAV9RPU8_9TELE
MKHYSSHLVLEAPEQSQVAHFVFNSLELLPQQSIADEATHKRREDDLDHLVAPLEEQPSALTNWGWKGQEGDLCSSWIITLMFFKPYNELRGVHGEYVVSFELAADLPLEERLSCRDWVYCDLVI